MWWGGNSGRVGDREVGSLGTQPRGWCVLMYRFSASFPYKLVNSLLNAKAELLLFPRKKKARDCRLQVWKVLSKDAKTRIVPPATTPQPWRLSLQWHHQSLLSVSPAVLTNCLLCLLICGLIGFGSV